MKEIEMYSDDAIIRSLPCSWHMLQKRPLGAEELQSLETEWRAQGPTVSQSLSHPLKPGLSLPLTISEQCGHLGATLGGGGRI